ncbi:PD-(D/E)XK motif protein [Saccharomonospora azurea]|uniref:PD-(D/E)XK motif protein n=1 Tax=Saccharomonospora azurea TaxID=40988 RepID=UPI003D8C7E75
MTSPEPVDKRHTSTANFGKYLKSRVPVLLPIVGDPRAFIFVQPLTPELGIRIAVDDDVAPPQIDLRNVTARVSSYDGQRYFEVVLTDSNLFRDAYPVLCSIADRVQLDGLTPVDALAATLEKMASLLLAPDTLPREREIGLFGELLFLRGLAASLGTEKAVQAWRGGLAEEHDFGLPNFDVEVKTTTAERRTHWIESLTQLVPTPERPLWLVSHQITVAGTGYGRTLAELIGSLREWIPLGPAREGFEKVLGGAGWRDSYSQRLTNRWTRRTKARAYSVTGSFPRLSPEKLRQGAVDLDRVRDVRYRIDLEGLMTEPKKDVPTIVANAIEFGEEE